MAGSRATRRTERVAVLAGGVGAARLLRGLSSLLEPSRLTVIVNTGDDFEHLGLKICPDIDTLTYVLAGLDNTEQGWGRRDETWSFMATIASVFGASPLCVAYSANGNMARFTSSNIPGYTAYVGVVRK